MNAQADGVRDFGSGVGDGRSGDDDGGGQTLDVIDKYHGTVAYKMTAASPEDLATAVALARRAVGTPLPAHRRYEILSAAADLLQDRRDGFVAALVAEAGKPRKASVTEVARSVETLRWSAEEAKRLTGQTIPLDAATSGVGRIALTLREPVGVVAAITPTNSPLNLVAHKVGPALAGGNAVVLKPPQVTPTCSFLLREVLLEAGLPTEFLSVVAGPGLGDPLLNHPDVDFYNFTGSIPVGEHLRRTVGLRDTLLELGGNSPVIVHHDADVRRAAAACAAKGFLAAGQACTSVQRVYVHSDVIDAFTHALVAATQDLKVGDPEDPTTDIGPMISQAEAERVEKWITAAVEGGARQLTGGLRDGSVLWPAVLVDVPHEARVYCEEVFGPVVVVEAYEDIDQVIDTANDTRYGLHAAVFTSSLEVAFNAINRLQAGAVLVNEATQWRTEFMPFGGIKNSGSGREGPRYAVEHMTRLKTAVLALEKTVDARPARPLVTD